MNENSQPIETENSRVTKAASVVGLATFLSRIFGYLRDVVIAAFFGAGAATDAFFVAFRIPNVLRRLFAEGSLTIAFIPIFTEYLKRKSRDDALELANIAFTLLSIILAVVSIIGVVFAPWVVRIIGWGFIETPDRFELTVNLTRLTFPYIFFISLVALCMGILNSLRHFAAPALAPLVLNLSMIAAVFLLRDFFDEPVTALAVGVLIGGILQLAMQLPFLKKMGVSIRANFHFNHPGIKRIGMLMGPAVFGAAVYQINVLVGTLLASFLAIGSVSYLYYADRLVQLPLGVFAVAIGTAALPSFSEHMANGQIEKLKETISFSLRLMLFVTIPSMVALIVLRVPIISVLFERGAFDAFRTAQTADALLWYSVGLWAFSLIRVIVPVFYSLQDTKTPVKVAVLALVVNVLAGLSLMFPMKHGGLALATSISSAVNVIVLSVTLRSKIGNFLDSAFYRSCAGTVVSSLFMAVSMGGVNLIIPWSNDASFSERTFFLCAAVMIGIVVFAASSFLFKNSEIAAVLRIVRRKLLRKAS
ncbi:MAG TPA: murein biosynthesis integral membrane protein MurJ [Deltaproteobacteria bacterium]|nr:murein biosynthesis integral membrane protein MurJ [Deltaproteobacteria bacterium]